MESVYTKQDYEKMIRYVDSASPEDLKVTIKVLLVLYQNLQESVESLESDNKKNEEKYL